MPGLLDFLAGTGLLGNQAAPQRQQQTLPEFAGTDNPLMAGFQNFTNARSPISAIGGLIGGLTTGQRTDPVGAYQQRANMVYGILRRMPDVTDQQAQLGALDPNVQKEIIQRQFPEYDFINVNGTLTPVEKHTGRIGYGGAYTPPRDITLSPGQGFGVQGPMVGGMPQGGGIPAPQSPITTAPLAPIPAPGPETPGATRAGGPPPSPTAGAPLGGPGTPGIPGAVAPASSGRGLPPGAGSGFTMVVPPMSVAEEARQREAGSVAGKAGQVLPSTVNELQSGVDAIDALLGNPEKRIPPHPGKAAAVGRLQGNIPATGLLGSQADFVRQLDNAQTIIAPLVGGNDKNKVEVTGTDRRQDPAQFDAQLRALRKTLTDKIEAAKAVAGAPGVGTPGAPRAPEAAPAPGGTGAAGASGAGQGAPKKTRAERFNELVTRGATVDQAHQIMIREGY